MKDEYKNDCAFNYLKSAGLSKINVDEDVTPEQIYAHLSLTPIMPPSAPEKLESIQRTKKPVFFLEPYYPPNI